MSTSDASHKNARLFPRLTYRLASCVLRVALPCCALWTTSLVSLQSPGSVTPSVCTATPPGPLSRLRGGVSVRVRGSGVSGFRRAYTGCDSHARARTFLSEWLRTREFRRIPPLHLSTFDRLLARYAHRTRSGQGSESSHSSTGCSRLRLAIAAYYCAGRSIVHVGSLDLERRLLEFLLEQLNRVWAEAVAGERVDHEA